MFQNPETLVVHKTKQTCGLLTCLWPQGHKAKHIPHATYLKST